MQALSGEETIEQADAPVGEMPAVEEILGKLLIGTELIIGQAEDILVIGCVPYIGCALYIGCVLYMDGDVENPVEGTALNIGQPDDEKFVDGTTLTNGYPVDMLVIGYPVDMPYEGITPIIWQPVDIFDIG